MTVTRVTINAAKLLEIVADTMAPELSQAECEFRPIIEVLPSGRIEIVDGYHRIAGMIAAGETEIECLTCDDDDLIGDAANAEDTDAQSAALRAIYAAA